jgi:hypothetical protein
MRKMRIISVILVYLLTLSLVLFSCDVPGSDIYTPPNNEPGDNRPTLTGTVSIDRTSPAVGDTLTATYSGGNGSGTATWQWLRDDVQISNSNSNTYIVASADEGKTLKAEVSYANQKGSVASAATTAVPGDNRPTITGTVSIDNTTPKVEDILTANYTPGNGTGTAEWQWLRNDTPITGATNTSYTVSANDVNAKLKAQVRFADQKDSVTSEATAVVPDTRPALTGTVAIDNTTPKVGDPLTATYSGGNGTGTAIWQWFRDNEEIIGTDNKQYKTGTLDAGKTLKAQVSYTDQKGSVTSAATSAVFAAVTEITGLPTSVTAGASISLTETVNPAYATNKTIAWSVKTAGTTGATISGSVLTTTAAGTATITATITNGTAAGTNYTQDFPITVTSSSSFVAVTNITNIPTTIVKGNYIILTGTVFPANATNKTIVWSHVTEETTATGVYFTYSNQSYILNTGTGIGLGTGIVTVKATIKDGTAEGTDYTQKFTITITPAPSGVTSITDVPTTGTAKKPVTLTGTVNPDNTFNKEITWGLLNAGATGAKISNGNLNTTAPGTVTVRATIYNGNGSGYDYTQDFDIKISPLSWTAVDTSALSFDTVPSITYGGPAGKEKFVAVGNGGKIAYSSDGINWTSLTTSLSLWYGDVHCNFTSVAYGGSAGSEKFIAVGDLHYWAYSTDGVIWSIDENYPYLYANDIIYDGPQGQKKFIISVNPIDPKKGTQPIMAYSTDGLMWTDITNTPFPMDSDLSNYSRDVYIAYSNGKFVAVGSGGNIAYSTNGVNWSSATITGEKPYGGEYRWRSITYGNGRFVAGGKGIAYSDDGVNWTSIPDGTKDNETSAVGFAYGIAYGGDRFVAVGNSGGVYPDSRMSYSIDGIHWTAIPYQSTENVPITTFGKSTINCIVYGGANGQKKFIAGGADGKMAWAEVPSY